MTRVLLLIALVSVFAVGCGKTEPPLTTDQLGADSKTSDPEATQTGGNVPNRPQVNPDAKYKPRR